VVNIEHWTSAKTVGPDASMMWCNGKQSVDSKQVNWKAGQPKLADGNCVFVQFSNSSANLTTFSLGDCAQERKFICDVIYDYLTYFITYFNLLHHHNRNQNLSLKLTPRRTSACFYLESQTVNFKLISF